MREDVERALAAVRAGKPVVFPTDTVYGIGAAAEMPAAVAALFAAKGRPEDKPIPVLAARPAHLDGIAVPGDAGRRLAAAFWPGPLTLVVPRVPSFTCDLGGGARDSVAVRIPAHGLALELLAATGPLAVTSANRSGEPPAMTVAEARSALGSSVEVYLDGGECFGPPSTIVSLVGEPKVLREGGLPGERVLQTLTS